MDRNTAPVLAAALAVLAARSAYAEPARVLEPVSRIDTVVVYPDRAQVMRAVEIEIGPGGAEVVLKDLPANLFENSEQARLVGTPKARITGIEVRRLFTEKPKDEEVVRLQTELQAIADQEKNLADSVAVLEQKERFLGSLQAAYAQKQSAEMIEAKLDLDGVASFMKLIEATYTEGLAKRRDVGLRKRELGEKGQRLKNELERLHGAMQVKEYKAIVVGIDGPAAEKVILEVSYVVPGASWRPVYDARLDSAAKKVELASRGVVTNSTGEKWEDVALVLSTARPSVAGRPPKLQPLQVDYAKPVPDVRMAHGTADNDPDTRESDDKAPSPSPDTTHAVAQAEAGVTAAFFRVTKRETVPSDGQPHKTTLAVQNFSADLEYECMPELFQGAFLKAAVLNGNIPILGGDMNVFMDRDFVGTSFVKNVAATQKFHLYLGVDQGVRVERKLVRQERASEGGFLSSSRRRATFGYSVSVENFKEQPVTMTLKERLPVAIPQDMEVRLEDATTPGGVKKETEPGIHEWAFPLKPQEKRTIHFEFSVFCPEAKARQIEASQPGSAWCQFGG